MNFSGLIRFAVVVCMVSMTTGLFAQGQVMFSYQGRVKVGGTPFEGNGQFKFAILSHEGHKTLWSHDGTSVDGDQPETSISLVVNDGIFEALIGDPDLQMAPINSAIFQSRKPLKLRVWFNDGVRGFQNLNPDHNLVNMTLTVLETGVQDFTIYVNGSTGDDANSGLDADEPKKTIQAAVDTLPDRIKCNVTIDVADGVYPEAVTIYGISVHPDKALRLIGDDEWTTASMGSPGVVISGRDSGTSTGPSVRKHGLHILQSSGIVFTGFGVEGFQDHAVKLENGVYDVKRCLLQNSLGGVLNQNASTTSFTMVAARSNTNDGFYTAGRSGAVYTDCEATGNGGAGFRGNSFCLAVFFGQSAAVANYSGVIAQHASSVVFTGKVRLAENVEYGMYLLHNSYCENHTTNMYVGNGIAPWKLQYNSMLTW